LRFDQVRDTMIVVEHCANLHRAEIQGVECYEKKLRDNLGDTARMADLFCEGRVARTFASNGWAITMRESPDLEGQLNGIYLGIEVKHFRYKPAHDPVEDAALISGDGLTLARVPFLSETEGHEEAWEQMCRFAAKNARQLINREFNILFFVCSTQAHDDATLETAVNDYDKAIQNSACDPAMKNLTAIMMSQPWSTVGSDHRSIFWKPVGHATKPLSSTLAERLDQIVTLSSL